MTSKARAEKELLQFVDCHIKQIHASEDEHGEDFIGIEVQKGVHAFYRDFFLEASRELPKTTMDKLTKGKSVVTDYGVEEKIIWLLRDEEGNGPGSWDIVDIDDEAKREMAMQDVEENKNKQKEN